MNPKAVPDEYREEFGFVVIAATLLIWGFAPETPVLEYSILMMVSGVAAGIVVIYALSPSRPSSMDF